MARGRRNRRNNRRRSRRVRNKNHLPLIFNEAHHGQIVPGSTITMVIPDDLPKHRIFRPEKVVCFFSGVKTPSVVQVSSYNSGNQRVATTGPITVPCGVVKRVVMRYPASEDNWPSDYANLQKTAWTVDVLCVSKTVGDDYKVIYSACDYWRYGNEEEAEACPKFRSTNDDGETITGNSLFLNKSKIYNDSDSDADYEITSPEQL